MTVEDFIEVLQQAPNLKVPVVVRVMTHDEDGNRYAEKRAVEDARFDGGSVIVEVE